MALLANEDHRRDFWPMDTPRSSPDAATEFFVQQSLSQLLPPTSGHHPRFADPSRKVQRKRLERTLVQRTRVLDVRLLKVRLLAPPPFRRGPFSANGLCVGLCL